MFITFEYQFVKRIGWLAVLNTHLIKRERINLPFCNFKPNEKVRLMNKKVITTTIILLVFILLTGCGSAPRFTSRESRFEKRIPSTPENLDRYKNVEPLETITGVASFYADQYDGKITYSGDVYDMYGLSAAHPTYQMGTIIRVTNLYNDKSVIIRINDKMPYRPDRIIDLSLGCAQELDMVNVGIQEVKVEVLEWGKGRK